MRIALLTDIHANLAALEAVLGDAESRRAGAVWQMGDVVGYGPDPDAVIARLRTAGAIGVLGNHDAAALGLIDTAEFNKLAAQAAAWTERALSAASKEYLQALPQVDTDGDYTRVHGSLRAPLWEYLRTYDAVQGHFALQQTRVSIVGHTHLPLFVREDERGQFDALTPGDGDVVTLGDERICINPGGVGQPRDGDARACYALLDTGTSEVSFYRIPYDIARTQKRMREAGLPEPLWARLQFGR